MSDHVDDEDQDRDADEFESLADSPLVRIASDLFRHAGDHESAQNIERAAETLPCESVTEGLRLADRFYAARAERERAQAAAAREMARTPVELERIVERDSSDVIGFRIVADRPNARLFTGADGDGVLLQLPDDDVREIPTPFDVVTVESQDRESVAEWIVKGQGFDPALPSGNETEADEPDA